MDIKTSDQLIEFIRKTRKRQKITQEQLADFTGLQRIGVVKIESGKSEPKISTVLRICDVLGIKVSFEYLGEE